MKAFINENDKYKMNWVQGDTEWGTVKAPEGIEVSVDSRAEGNVIVETYRFTNRTDKDIFTSLKDISIYTPFPDDYPDAATCMTNRCHAHIWCGGNVSYVMAVRMGGEGPHLGLALTQGSLGGYSVERDLSKSSNDRGDFILHPSPVSLIPGESFTVSWTLFWYEDRAEFYDRLKQYNPRYIHVEAEKYVVFENEEIHFSVKPAFDYSGEEVVIRDNGAVTGYTEKDGVISVREKASLGEHTFEISVCGVQTFCRILALPAFSELARRRCRFIAKRQQYHRKESGLNGAYLIYDNEEKHLFYSAEYDFNGGRERVGMGVLIARYLQEHEDKVLSASLDEYVEYVERELFDKETGIVYNEYQRDNTWNRLYNYPFVSTLYIELYKLYGRREMLLYAYRSLLAYYDQKGAGFYALEVPVYEMISGLEKEHMTEEKAKMMECFTRHCDMLIKNGVNYPASEVNYEQSIVAPAAYLLLQMFRVTGDQKYLKAAEEQMRILELFNGSQPDFHLYETAIRHWDGYWFGKRRMYGDTFPHYWSAITGNVYSEYAEITGNEEYRKKADASHRGVLSMFMPDGSASAACVYPVTVNGDRAGFYDPYANDQDWGMYYMLRYGG